MYSKILVVNVIVVVLFLTFIPPVSSRGSIRKKLPAYEYGTIMMDNLSSRSGVSAVVFRHWVHRSRHSCRLCHVDIGFAMRAGETRISEQENLEGKYCGACHDGREAFAPHEKDMFGKINHNCSKCHTNKAIGENRQIRERFDRLTRTLPPGRLGNGVDWAESVRQGKTNPKDFISGVSFERPKLRHDEGVVNLDAKLVGLPDIIFSHQDHAVWNGCELCHPDVFMLKASGTKFSMQEIFAGRYCGACHGRVAFPLQDCGRCHSQSI